MLINLCYHGKTYSLPKSVNSYQALQAEITVLFRSTQLPSYSLHYIDEENDRVILTDERDFRTMLSSIPRESAVTIFMMNEEYDNEYEIIYKDDALEEYLNADSPEERLYPQSVQEKAEKLKQLIPENEIDAYLHYVSLDPSKSIEELAEEYLSYYANRESKVNTSLPSKLLQI